MLVGWSHIYVMKSHIYVSNSFFSIYSKFRDIKIARLLFAKTFVMDFSSWSIAISRYVKNGKVVNAWRFLMT